MILHIHKLPVLTDLALDVTAQECELPAEFGTLMSPVHLEVRVRKIEQEITVTGNLRVDVELVCARCLQRYTEEFADEFDVVYVPQPQQSATPAEEIELCRDDANVCYYVDDTLSLIEIAREQLLLISPIKPLCQPDCAGICPICGQNRNEVHCACTQTTLDPRLAVLQQLLKPSSP